MKYKGMLNTSHYDRIYEAFAQDRPFDAKHALGYRPVGEHKIRVELDDGTYVDYVYINGYGKYIREKPRHREDITRSYVHNEFADNLRDMMIRRGVNQQKLSEITGLSQGIISGYLRRNEAYDESGQKRPVNPTIDKVRLLSWALDCEPYELI